MVESRFFGGPRRFRRPRNSWESPKPPSSATGARPRPGSRTSCAGALTLKPRPRAERIMDAQRWERIQTLFHEAADLPPADQRAFLEARTADDPSIVPDVLGMLAEDRREGSLLDHPIWRSRGQRSRIRRGRSLLQADRSLPPDPAARRGRHGRGLPRRARGPGQPGGDQDSARRVAVAGAPRALRQRAAHAGPAQPSVDRAALRRRHAPGRHPVVRDGVRRGRSDHRVLRGAPVHRAPDPRALPRRLRRRAARAPARRHPPRPQAVEHPRDARRPGEAPRLRHREAARDARLRPPSSPAPARAS